MREERCIWRVAKAQNWVITTRQLKACGLSKSAIDRRVAKGRLFSKHRGVYAVGRADLSPAGVCLAAVLAVGEGSVLSHRSAAGLWGFWTVERDVVDVKVARRGVRARRGIRLHRVSAIPRADWGWHDGVPVSLPAQTVLDLAATVRSDERFRRIVHEALVQERVSWRALAKVIETHPSHSGAKRLEAELAGGAKPTRSSFEDWGVQLLRYHRFPTFETNVHPPGTPKWVEVDVLFLAQRLVIEIDGGRFHDTPYRRERDAKKQALLEEAAYRVLRLRDDDARPEHEIRTVKRIRNALT